MKASTREVGRCRLIFAVLALSVLQSAAAWSLCDDPRPRLVCAEYFHSKAVVTAKLVRTRAFTDKDGFVAANIYYMHTLQVLRGDIDSNFEIYEGNDSGRAGFDWKKGQAYLLFLRPSVERKGSDWAVDGCGNSGTLERADPVLKQIRNLKNQKGGMIQVAVGLGAGYAGAAVSVRGNGKSYSAVTDQHGRSEIRVLPGRYSIKAVSDVPLETYFMSYEQPEITVVDGSCAQIQFVAADKNQ